MIQFDEKTHRYFDGDKPVLSVTQYLKLAGFVDDEWYTVEGRERGRAVHAAMHYLVQGDLDESSIHPTIKPYIEAGRKFLNDTGFKPNLIEHIVYDPVYGYGGTLDVTGKWNLTDGLVLLDYKTGQVAPWAQIQLAAYSTCLSDYHRRFALQLLSDGSYKLSKEYQDRNDIKIFRASVALVNWKIQNGIISEQL